MIASVYKRVLSARRMRIVEDYALKATNIRQLIKLADFWKRFSDDFAAGKHLDCLHRMLAMAQNTDDWTLCAGAWKAPHDHENAAKALKCIRKAEMVARNSRDWSKCAATWICQWPHEGHDDDIFHCLKISYRLAKTTNDFSELATIFLWLICDFKTARFLMRMAANNIISDDDRKNYAIIEDLYKWCYEHYKDAESDVRLPPLDLTTMNDETEKTNLV